MRKVIKIFIFSLALLFTLTNSVSAATPVPSPSPTPMPSSFEMFWPVVAGKVKGESLYGLKILKEKLREAIIFSDFRKADYNITLSVKRVVEAEKLYLQDKKYENAKMTLEAAQEKRQRALDFINKAAVKGQSVVDIKNAFKSSLEKQTALLTYIQSQVPDSEKQTVANDIKFMKDLASKLQ